jgi:DNA invertase Pin-like site-specific DNA recombinase
VQRQAIRQWAQAEGHKIVATHSDEGVSGAKDLSQRVGLADALSGVKASRAQGLVVYKLDRLARDLVLQEQLLAEVHRAGGEVFSTSAAEQQYLVDDPEDPSRRLIRQVLGAVSEYERSMISLRLRSGRKRKAELGGFAYGSPPYGTATAAGRLVADEFEQANVARMRSLRRNGASLREIASTLEAEGRRPRRSGHWHPSTVQRVLGRSKPTFS